MSLQELGDWAFCFANSVSVLCILFGIFLSPLVLRDFIHSFITSFRQVGCLAAGIDAQSAALESERASPGGGEA